MASLGVSCFPKHRILRDESSEVRVVVSGFDVEEVGFSVSFFSDESVFVLVGVGLFEDDTL